MGWLLVLAVCVMVGWLGWGWWNRRNSKPTPPPTPSRIQSTPRSLRTLPPLTPPSVDPTTDTPVAPPVQVSTQALKWIPPVTPPAIPETVPTNAASAGDDPAIPWSPREATTVLEAQVALASHGINAGPIDGVAGSQTAAALRAFQLQQGLEGTGILDRDTQRALILRSDPMSRITVHGSDLARIGRVPRTWLGKSQATELGYESALEMVAEQCRSHPNLVRKLNPGVDWDRISPGQSVAVPSPRWPPARRAARMRVSLAGRYLRAFDDRGRLLCHFPCSIGKIASKRPVGDLHVVVAVKEPNYTFDPKTFPESAEARSLGRRLVLPPGPNNPVGLAWIGLDRPGFGIHGTPAPEQVGRTESHGCFRLANWNAEYLRQMVWVGMPVSVEP